MDARCGCPDCGRQAIPHNRNQWKNRTNKHGRIYGSHCKGTHHRGRYRKV